ncbi:MAG: DUF2726 domain-containing protein [Verrucomicrobiales bacterium]
MKVEALNEASAQSAAIESAPVEALAIVEDVVTGSFLGLSIAYPRAAVSDDPRALLNEGETRFYHRLKIALADFDCQVLAKVHLPALTKRADEALQPAVALNRALAALRSWEADFAICRGDSLVVVAVVRLRSKDDISREPERANLEEALESTLAAASIPVVQVAEAACYQPEYLASLIRPHLPNS